MCEAALPPAFVPLLPPSLRQARLRTPRAPQWNMRASAETMARRAQLQRCAARLTERQERFIAGCDEAGAGALAGPLVAAAVMLDSRAPAACQPFHPLLDDSKRLSQSQRQRVFAYICDHSALSVVHCVLSPAFIDKHNVLNARLSAMRHSVLLLPSPPQMLFVDGHLTLPRLSCPQQAIVRADSRISLVAAAGIVAKVLRDDLMRHTAQQYPEYAFERNFGYPTKLHRLALSEHGPCPIHRFSFKPVRDAAASLSA